MPQGPAIIARLGLDIGDFNKETEKAVAKIQDFKKQGEKTGGGIKLKEADTIKEKFSGITRTLLAGGGAADLFVNSATQLAGVFAVSGPIGAAIGVTVAIGAALHASAEEAKKLKKQIEEALAPRGAVAFSTLSGIQEQLTKTTAAAQALKEKVDNPGFWGSIGKNLAAVTPGSSLHHDTESKDRGDLAKAAQGDIERMAAKEAKLLDIEELRLNVSDKAAAFAKIESDLAEKKGEILALQQGLSAADLHTNARSLVTEAERAAELKKAVIAKKELEDTDDAKAQLTLIEYQVKGLHAQAEAYATVLNYQKQIEAAEKAGNKPQAAVLKDTMTEALWGQAKAIADAHNEQNTAAREHIKVMQAENNGSKNLAATLQIEATYRAKVAAAIKEQNGQAEILAKTERDEALRKLAIDQALKTPDQKRQERAQERRQERAGHAVDSQVRDEADRAARGAYKTSPDAYRVAPNGTGFDAAFRGRDIKVPGSAGKSSLPAEIKATMEKIQSDISTMAAAFKRAS